MGIGWRRLQALSALAVILGMSAACSFMGAPDAPRTPDATDQIQAVDLGARAPRGGGGTGPAPAAAQGESYYGMSGMPVRIVAQQRPGATGEGYELNFENAPVTTVAKVILGDILGVGYIIDPRVQATVSLSSGRPVPKSDMLYVLESALRMSNVALVREAAGSYRLVPAPDAVGTGAVDFADGPSPGSGVSVVPLYYVSAAALAKLADSFVTKAGTIRVDQARNLVVIQGSSAERRAATEFVLSFDADWMRGQSVGIYPVQNSTPEPIISELERIMDTGDGGLAQGAVKLQAIGRMNAIMVVARKPELLRAAQTWIGRLDRADASSTSVRVYRVRYGEAKQLANILNDIFTGRSATSFDTPASQIAPGGGMSVTSSGSAGAGGPPMAAGLGAGASAVPMAAGTSAQSGPPSLTIAGARTLPGGGDSRGPTSDATTSSAGRGGGAVGVLPGVRITADVINNALLIYANQENYRIIERTLVQLDRPQLQVSIDATIAEVTLNKSLSYGVQALLKSQDLGLGNDKGSVIFNPINTSSVLGRVLPGFNFLLGSELDPRLVLDALRGVTDVKVLSTPSVVVIDNQVATLQVGDQVPIATASATVLNGTQPIVNTIDYRNTGVILRVAPRINANGNVLLDIEQEISNVAGGGGSGSLTPTVSQRKVKSSIAIANGQTVLLGGLISERQDRSRTGLPFLDQIPAVDDILSRNSTTQTRTEIIIFIRPQIIRDGMDAQRVAEELRAKMGGRVGASTQRGPVRFGN
jgi:general secretion pathway protein D